MAEPIQTTVGPDALAFVDADWHAAYGAFRPLYAEWSRIFEYLETLPRNTSAHAYVEQQAYAFVEFAKAQRDRFMAVPAPDLPALIVKMEIGDPVDDEHHEACLADLRRIAAGGGHE